MDREFITGKNPIIEALRSGRPMNKIWIGEGSQKGQMQKVLELAKEQGVLVQHVPKRKLDQLIGHENHQGVVASVAAYEYAEMDDLFQRAAEKGEEPFFIVLDEVEDPHNLGSILRTADAAGVHGVIIPKRRAVGLTQTVAKASTGAIEYVPVVRVTNLARTMEDLKKRGLWFIGTDAKGSEDYRGAAYDMPIALVIGSEGKGLSRLVREKCDFLVRIPMVGQVTSLNASVATSLLMYEAYRKRHPLGRE
ncbi:23S rRNA (guanosine(2251)-2'-O)-methyltransferase RlmB [Halalkalibacterium halodurans]|uniref:tRNA/rRNA methyltransferase n=1 Tax=Halalkalibacterium halodurans (strain ATCC BAA-125 / DSM 18197 / FERM 7344 / JCM 9153 / C-125) TaxID=272558 RepID=Q9KGF2_HALH5|nr:23S rRNA (guanosine(2251)-2'-O)-methyltransferase RlmB [Halalkalibacterium halodurans]MDY7220615.1 23S rRNA (guanosine(2251)-2'-O)-methyltransferase RlmB [Halalkalibacterium halodurans]MDY7239854.1 23S rRNA (guanosine(2251)-2'-O)-methyltransferase RlmB [Halalkalibacterium halodurans]MED4081219.1 23S rRNA (guanosine(2251)-2'-O)-methyltransferase RlmB [Halalkalibacterium halodurans]MED4083934.1 23S rRNA (guanosine(2251)-2'-O)-methyltransferase RlmB [Halalkalibacterium halodurans]MED4106061.1 